ncbi:hypothetical protein [Nodularia chucula]
MATVAIALKAKIKNITLSMAWRKIKNALLAIAYGGALPIALKKS